ncbi:S41 family peptidase [Streptomyces sp. NPDC090231]|uniref:S41 family peptidase n=1 Tax=unclassified Streptomyces TaxID=2593676 RepID=UPI00381674E1
MRGGVRGLSSMALGFVVLAAVAGCTGADADGGTEDAMAPKARAYLASALDVMEKHSLLTKDVDWPKLRKDAFAEAGQARTPSDTYRAIRQGLQDLNDGHSTFYDPEAASEALNAPADDLILPEGRRLVGNIGHLTLPPEPSDQVAAPYVRSARSIVAELDGQGVCGWIIDVRSNSGGDMWGPLAAVGAVLGDGTVGSAVYAGGKKSPWTLRNGTPRQYLDRWGPAKPLARPAPPVAVLTSRRTASAAEAVTIAFRGRPDTRTFGEATKGVPTANVSYELSDGALVILTVAREADRTGRLYHGPLEPDVKVPEKEAPAAAAEWLRKQRACRSAR